MTQRQASKQIRPHHGEAGATLAELLVVLAIISILAVTAVPFAETTMQRRKEIELQETLRSVRQAIDAFHQDWRADRFAKTEPAASINGYPVTMEVLINGVDVALESGARQKRRYLRATPTNPFAARSAEVGDAWRLIGYAQPGDSAWDGQDVYDLQAVTEKEALNGARIADW